MSSSSYLVLARKYRPTSFDELVGQEILVKTLSNAIRSNKIHHSFILTGIRGVGKTTTARIIAKTINCLDEQSKKQAKCCNICSNCQAITMSKHQDVIEIDAASRTGVNDIREIIDSIAYAPIMSQYKIYIIDEFHMLSNSAFNALLKTLEEPPAHIKFIFATTEIKKVPVTIISRCQKFDLRRLNEEEITAHLSNILNKEGLKAEDSALEMIANASEGSVRDSLSLLDRALCANNYQQFLTADIVESMLCLNDKNQVIELFHNITNGDFTNSLNIFNNFYLYSSDVMQLFQDLIEILNLVINSKLAKNYKIDHYSHKQQLKIKELSHNISTNNLLRIWQLMIKSYNEISYSHSPKIAFEMMIAKICHLIAIPNLEDILSNISDIKAQQSYLDENKNIAKQEIDNKNIKSADTSNPSNENTDISTKSENELVNELLRNFTNAKIIS